MSKILAIYHERMFYFWYGRNAAFRDYHGKKYHQLMSIPKTGCLCGVNFRSYKNSILAVAQGAGIVAGFALAMLALVAQFA